MVGNRGNELQELQEFLRKSEIDGEIKLFDY